MSCIEYENKQIYSALIINSITIVTFVLIYFCKNNQLYYWYKIKY